MLKTILVHLTGTERDEDVLAAACLAAKRFSAHLDCLYARPDPMAVTTWSTDLALANSVTLAETMRAVKEAGQDGARRAVEIYHRFLRSQDIAAVDAPAAMHHVSAAFRQETGDAADVLIEAARSHDLAVLAGGQEHGLSADDAGSVLVESGRPVLLAPVNYALRSFKTIAIAWKNSPEAARAITASMPLLEQAAQIVVLGAHESGPQDRFAKSLDGVVAQLRWHGLKAESRVVAQDGSSVPQAVLKAARHAAADLLVMGGYGHSRLREMIFGGFTEHVLHGIDMPVLISH